MMLDAVDRQSLTWTKLREHYESRLNTLRRQNDGDLDERQTAKLRGRIAEVKAMIALGDEAQKIEQEPYIE